MSEPTSEPHNPWWKKIGWLILIWSASVATLWLLAYALKLFMRAAGLAG